MQDGSCRLPLDDAARWRWQWGWFSGPRLRMLVVRLAQPRAHATPRLREADEEVEDLGQVLNADRQYRLDYQNDISSGSWVTAAVRDAYARIGADPLGPPQRRAGLSVELQPSTPAQWIKVPEAAGTSFTLVFRQSRGGPISPRGGRRKRRACGRPRGRRRAWPLSCAIL